MRKSQPIDALIDARPNQMHGDSAIGHVKHVRVFRTGSVEIFNGTVRPGAPAFRNSLIQKARSILARGVPSQTLNGLRAWPAVEARGISNLSPRIGASTMNFPSTLKNGLIGAAFTAFAAGAASAATIVQQQVTGNDLAPWGTNLTFNKFDPSLGTLTGVQIDFKGFGSGSAQVTHGTGAGSISMDQLGSTTQITAPGLIALTTNDFIGTQVFLWAADSPSPTNFDTGIFSTNTLNVIGSGFWGDYTGPGTFDIAVAVRELIAWDSTNATGDFGEATFKTYGGADVKLTYDYNVPEPGSLALLALGGLAAGFVRRRRKA